MKRMPRPALIVAAGFAVFLFLAVCVVAALVWRTSSQTNALPGQATSTVPATNEGQTQEATPIPSTGLDLYRLSQLAQSFDSPSARPAADSPVSVENLLASPGLFAGQTITVTGELIHKTLVYNLAPRDWPRAYYLNVAVEGIELPVVYRGYVGHLQTGNPIQVVGAFSADGLGINADQISPVGRGQRSEGSTGFGLPLWVATTANVLWAVFCVTVFVRRARASVKSRRRPGGPAMAAAALLVAVFLTGCTIDIVTTVHTDGHGTVGVTFNETVENVDFLRGMPGMHDYFQTWRDDLRSHGVLVDDSAYQGVEQIHLQSVFGSVNDIEQAAPASASERSWVFANVTAEATERVFRYSALVDTTALFEQAPGIDANVAAEARGQLEQTKITYSVSLPGQIVYQNASRMIGNQLIWDIRMNDQNQIRAEARLAEPAPPDFAPLVWLAQGAAFVVFSLLLLLGLVAFRARKA